MAKNQEPKVTIDDKDYLIKDLSAEAMAQIESLHFVENEIVRLNALLAVTATARNAYKKGVADALPKEEGKD